MILALGEDGVLSVFSDIHDVRRACEGIDVDNAVWSFFDENGRPLLPVFNTPNVVKPILFGTVSTVVSSRDFDFLPITNGSKPGLLEILPSNVTLDRNPYFSTIEQVRTHLSRMA
jgi:hypothetical protein